jgi:hypothetical protein
MDVLIFKKNSCRIKSDPLGKPRKFQIWKCWLVNFDLEKKVTKYVQD